jgi:hypothetical protein
MLRYENLSAYLLLCSADVAVKGGLMVQRSSAAYAATGQVRGCEQIAVKGGRPRADILLAARGDSEKITTLPPFSADLLTDLEDFPRLYEIRHYLGSYVLQIEPARVEPYTEIDLERLERRMTEDAYELNPLALAEHLREGMHRRGFDANLNRRVQHPAPGEYLFQ